MKERLNEEIKIKERLEKEIKEYEEKILQYQEYIKIRKHAIELQNKIIDMIKEENK